MKEAVMIFEMVELHTRLFPNLKAFYTPYTLRLPARNLVENAGKLQRHWNSTTTH